MEVIVHASLVTILLLCLDQPQVGLWEVLASLDHWCVPIKLEWYILTGNVLLECCMIFVYQLDFREKLCKMATRPALLHDVCLLDEKETCPFNGCSINDDVKSQEREVERREKMELGMNSLYFFFPLIWNYRTCIGDEIKDIYFNYIFFIIYINLNYVYLFKIFFSCQLLRLRWFHVQWRPITMPIRTNKIQVEGSQRTRTEV